MKPELVLLIVAGLAALYYYNYRRTFLASDPLNPNNSNFTASGSVANSLTTGGTSYAAQEGGDAPDILYSGVQ